MISNDDLRYLKLAETSSYHSDYPRIKIGAIVAKKKLIISAGFNKTRTHPEQLKHNKKLPYKINLPRLHAEIDALVKAKNNSKGATLYVFRRGKDGEYRNCKPCKSCMSKICESGIKRVVHTIHNGIAEISV